MVKDAVFSKQNNAKQDIVTKKAARRKSACRYKIIH